MCGYKIVLETRGRGDTHQNWDLFMIIRIRSLKELLPEIRNALPKLNGVVPCFQQSDHMNHLGALQCSECNPNDFYN